MSFVKLNKNFIERSTLTLRPNVKFVSSSIGLGVTGSEYISPVRSKCIKNIIDPSKLTQNNNADYDENDYNILVMLSLASEQVNKDIVNGTQTPGLDSYMNVYMESANDAPKDVRFTKQIDMFRFDTPILFNKNFNIKNNIRKNIIPYHKHRYPRSGFHYTNYNCLNFYTGSDLPTHSCLLYPNISDIYTPTSAFCLDFWINPRYSNESGYEFHAGTIFHMSSSLCISLVSGSSRDQNNLVDNFKLLVQLSQSADVLPSSIDITTPAGNYPNDLIFTSSHNLKKNHWHHVLLQWGQESNNSNVELYIDSNKTQMQINSSSLKTSNELISVGNYINTTSGSCALLFNTTTATAEGLTVLTNETTDAENQEAIFTQPLNAEIHNIRLFNKTLNAEEISKIKYAGIDNTRILGSNLYDSLLFYVPPFFYPETRTREVISTPFQTLTTTTNDPFNVQFSFGVGGKMINLENFTREFKQGEFPRMLSLSGSIFSGTIENITTDQYVYNTGSIVKRNTTILPCDNGLFKPNYYPIKSSVASSNSSRSRACLRNRPHQPRRVGVEAYVCVSACRPWDP